MPRFSANLSFLYPELPFLDRIDAAGASGFRGVEYMAPYDYELAEIKKRLRAHGLAQVLFNLPVGNFAAGERGYATDPTRVNVLCGIAVPGLDAATARATLIENVQYAAASLAAIGATLVVEPLNRIETPNFVIGTTAEGLALIAEADAPNFALQYDCYHAQRSEGNIIATLRANIARIKHVQLADSPGRNEPGTGELAYERILPVLDELGYAGWVGLEYKPSRATDETLGWMRALAGEVAS